MTIPAMAAAVLVPLLFLALVRWLDLYASGNFKGVFVCFSWGAVAFFFALGINTFIEGILGFTLLVTLVAPVVEEIFKSIILIYYVRRSDFTYFVDGAIYGFAAGVCFAVLENLLYLGRAPAGSGLALAFGRTFSTALMHGTATALVGIALGRLRYGRSGSRFASLFLGWAAAMALHIAFNNTVHTPSSALTLALAVGIGLGLVILFILWGLAEERRWLRETLGLKVGVSAGESAIVQKMDDLDALLAPVGDRFGAVRRKRAEGLFKLQAQLGLKCKVQKITPDPELRAEMELQVAALRHEIDAVRRGLGVYCMSYVRSILPSQAEPLWAQLGQALAARPAPSGPNLWTALDGKLEKQAEEKLPPAAMPDVG